MFLWRQKIMNLPNNLKSFSDKFYVEDYYEDGLKKSLAVMRSIDGCLPGVIPRQLL